jgi:GR25 family glycosyltransferase involved in LPS biosynthesis
MNLIILILCAIIVGIILIILFNNKLSEEQLIMLENFMKPPPITKDINAYLQGIPIYYINRDCDKDRRKNIENQTEYFNIKNIHRINAVDGTKFDNIKNVYVPEMGMWVDNNYSISKSELGCTLSHIKAITTAFQNGDEYALILEDDITFNLFYKNNIKILDDIINKAPKDWSIIMLYSSAKAHTKDFKKLSLKDWGCVSYIVNKKCMRSISRFIFDNKIVLDKYNKNNYDDIKNINYGTSDQLIYSTSKDVYVYKTLFIPNNLNLESTIHNSHTNGHLNYSFMYSMETNLK